MSTKPIKSKKEKSLTPRNQRLVDALRPYFNIHQDRLSDTEILTKSKATLIRQLVEIEIAKKDFAKAAVPVINKAAKDIKRAFSNISINQFDSEWRK